MSFNLLFSSIFTFPNEKTMLLKEREAGMYPISAFFFGRTMADIPLDMAIPICATTIIYCFAGLKPDVGAIMLTLMLTGGFFVQNIPVWLSWLSYLSFMSYAWDALMNIQLNGRVPTCPPDASECAMLNMGA